MDGFLNINKPAGFTSHDVVNVLKRSFPRTKIGHGGTLDPAATGVLVICLGKGTKLQEYVMGGTKVYESDIVFGLDSSTLDMDGDIRETDPAFSLDEAALRAVLPRFTGEIEQLPPMVSALKKDGVPLYKLARQGLEVARAKRRVTIDDLTILAIHPEGPFPRLRLRITCSSGTYVRALARDIGAALGTSAVADRLVRTASGPFRLADALTITEAAECASRHDPHLLYPLNYPLAHLPVKPLQDLQLIERVKVGQTVHMPVQDHAVYRLEVASNLLALARPENKDLKPYRVFYRRPQVTEAHIVQKTSSINFDGRQTAVALGNFDGVHGGHQLLIETMASNAANRGLLPVVCTFEPHPGQLLRGDDYKVLQTGADKARHLAAAGGEVLLFLPFDHNLAATSPADFVDRYLLEQLRAATVYVGYNFHFGRDGVADATWLQQYGREKGLDVVILDPIRWRGKNLSTTAIKDHLINGQIEEANQLLRYPYYLRGIVVEGRKIGRTIGLPTANLTLPSSLLLPADGVYIAYGSYDGLQHPGVCSIGTRPTIGDELQRTVEIHILDEEPSLYGKEVTVSLIKKIRDNYKMNGLSELRAQITRDVMETRHYFEKLDGSAKK